MWATIVLFIPHAQVKSVELPAYPVSIGAVKYATARRVNVKVRIISLRLIYGNACITHLAWRRRRIVSCTEKVKVMTQNMNEFVSKLTQRRHFEDALLMGCSEQQISDYLLKFGSGVDNPYRNR